MPTNQLPLESIDRERWSLRLDASRKLREDKIEVWKDSVSAYLGKPLTKAPTSDTIVVNKEFSFLELKKSQLAFQVPEVHLKPKLPGLEGPTRLFQSAVNHELGPDGAKAKRMFDEVLFDVLATGIGASKIGYTAVLGERQELETDPATGQPLTDPMGQPLFKTQPYMVSEEYFWRSISPDKLLVPAKFEGSDFDEADWLGWEFTKDWEAAKREYGLSDTFAGRKREDMETLSGEKEAVSASDVSYVVSGVEIWYRASRFDPEEEHPEKIRRLVLVDGREEPVIHMDSPYQQINQAGKLIGMMGFPIHVLTLRYVRGSAYPPSDIELGRPLTDELSKGRTQMVRQRDTSVPARWFDRNRVDPDTSAKLKTNTVGGWIPLEGRGDEVLGEVVRAQFPRESFEFDEIINRDYEELWALGKNQRGLTDETTKTATEVATAQNAADVRLDYERQRVLAFFTQGVRKFAALLQLFKDDMGYVEILGQEAQGLQPWNRQMVQGEFLFEAKPDSALRTDVAAERKQALDLYNLTANDPNVARVELLRSLMTKYNLDPARIVVDTLPAKGPEPPRLSISMGGPELAAPTPMMLQLLEQAGVKITPQMVQQAAAGQFVREAATEAQSLEHGGPAEQQNPLSKHVLRGDGRDGRMGGM